MRVFAGLMLATVYLAGVPSPAVAYPSEIVLPGASSAEGIAVGRGSTFFAGDLFRGDVFKGDLRSGEVDRFVDAPDGRMAVGLKVDRRGRLLFVAGGPSGQAYVYDTTSGAEIAVYQLGDPANATFVNDVAVTRDAAWFTDSLQPVLYRIELSRDGHPGAAETLALSGPAADTSGEFNLNGIAATPNGRTLLVSHSGQGTIITVDPDDGSSATVAGVSVPSPDGILFEAGRLWVVQNFLDQVARVDLAPDLASGTVEAVITSPRFQVPTTVARDGSRLAVVNAKFDTGFPPTADEYEVVIVPAR
ncbi:MAG: SMP-30/gluconolactonase/LRE family protein [Acidimicrobiales bacterium]